LRDQHAFEHLVDVAVEDGADIGVRFTRAGIFDLLVGLHDVGSDLVPPADFAFFNARLFGLFLLEFIFVQAGFEHLHRGSFVLVLAAVVLALYDDAGGFMRDPNGRLGFVDVLPAGPRSAVGVDADIFVLDDDIDVVVDFGGDHDGSKGGVPFGVGVERADAYQAVDAVFDLEIAVGVLPFDDDGRILDPGLLAALIVKRFDAEAAPFGPARAIYKQNPMQSVPDYYKTAEFLKSIDLVVVNDIIVNDTAFYADVILPDVSYLERTSLVKSFALSEPAIVWRSKAMEPMYDSKNIYYMCSNLAKRVEKPLVDTTFKYTWDEDDLEAKLPKDFKISKYLTEDFEVNEAKLKADIKDEKLVKAIITHANDDLEIETYKITNAFKETPVEFNRRVMKEIYGEEAAKIAEEYGAYWPGIEGAIKDGVIDPKYKVLKKDTPDKHEAVYGIYEKYSTLPKDFPILPKKGKWIKLAQHELEGKTFKNPNTGKMEKLGKFPMWRDSLFREPKEGEFKVVLGRHAYFTQSAGVNNALLLDLMNYNYIWINDEVAAKKGLKFKDDVILTNKDGKEIKAKVFPTKRIRKDTAYIATGFGSKSKLLTLGENNGISQAEVCDNSIDPIIGSASMNETIITIKKV
jgi:anaerobic selenocysteine-containing dehydrogenase